jgi:hypothetical protein
MYSLRKARRRVGTIGKPLPDPFLIFGMNNIKFRHGGTSMIAGLPGSFKSVFALNLMYQWAKHDVSCLYICADSDEFTVFTRAAGILTGDDTGKVEQNMLRGNWQKYEDEMKRYPFSLFEWANMDIDGIVSHCKTFEALYGDYPDVVIIDNLIDMIEDTTSLGQMRQLTRDLDIWARETKSHIVILHHTREGGDGTSFKQQEQDATRAQPRFKIQGKVTQKPQVVLTIAHKGPALYMACVKNRTGPDDSMAQQEMQFLVGPSCTVTDVTSNVELTK